MSFFPSTPSFLAIFFPFPSSVQQRSLGRVVSCWLMIQYEDSKCEIVVIMHRVHGDDTAVKLIQVKTHLWARRQRRRRREAGRRRVPWRTTTTTTTNRCRYRHRDANNRAPRNRRPTHHQCHAPMTSYRDFRRPTMTSSDSEARRRRTDSGRRPSFSTDESSFGTTGSDRGSAREATGS